MLIGLRILRALRGSLGALVLVFGFTGFPMAHAQTGEDSASAPEPPEKIEAIVVVGSRRASRSVLESPAPIDVLGPEDLRRQAGTDMDDILRTLSPSYNVQRHGIDDEATLVRPATLRGLPPDNTLLLVNGKRRHRSGVIALLGSSLTAGSQGPDLSVIPTIAIEQIELLRDGASAQYGSDAIAGVLNYRLKDANEGISLEARYGEYFEGTDGETLQIAGNIGLPLTEAGFLNLSLEYRDAEPTVRSGTRANAAELIRRGYPVASPAQIWGSPEVDNAWSFLVNAGIELGGGVEAYAFGGYAKRTNEGGFFFRAPGSASARNGVFRSGTERVVADLAPTDAVDCTSGLPSLTADFAAVESFVDANSGRCFLFNERFPGGFTPRFGADITDWSGVAGVRGEFASGLRWDASVGYGRSNIEFFLYNTVNASLGPDTPTSFRPRDYLQTEVSLNLEFAYPLELGFLASPLNIAWGAEWREETFESKPGDPKSYEAGAYGSQGFSVGSNGYQGLNPKFAGEWDRPNYALYLDLEADATDALLLGVAVRYEDFYDDFGDTLNGKLSALWRVTDRISLRSTASTGFRAPSPGQANLRVLATTFSGEGGLIESGQLPATDPVATALGGEELTEEEAFNFSFGVVIELAEELDLTLDYFDISIEDRIALTGNISITDEITRLIESQDVFAGAGNLKEIKFFANDFDTRTRGLDLVLTWSHDWDSETETDVNLAWNWTKTDLDDFSPPRQVSSFPGKAVLDQPLSVSLLTRRREVEIEDMNPEHRVVLTGRHRMGPWSALLRLSYFDDWKACRFQNSDCASGSGEDYLDSFDGEWIADAEIGYAFTDHHRVDVGVQNIFDRVPRAPVGETLGQGNRHPESTPWDYNGAFWYARISAEF